MLSRYIVQEYCDAGSLAQAIDAGMLVDPHTKHNNMVGARVWCTNVAHCMLALSWPVKCVCMHVCTYMCQMHAMSGMQSVLAAVDDLDGSHGACLCCADDSPAACA